MKHIDILINVLTLLSGVVTALLGFLLYLKYKIKAIRHYSLYVLTTTFTVTFTTIYSYLFNSISIEQNSLSYIFGFLLFQVFIILINYSFSLFVLEIISKPFGISNKALVGFPCLILLLSTITLSYYNFGRDEITFFPVVNNYFMIILFCLFFTFIIYSIQIAVNLKNIDNLDLKRALKTLALLIIIFIPIQSLIVTLNGQWIIIMLSRNIFYFLANTISIFFAAKYFFIETPSIMDTIEISDYFVKKYEITSREREIIELMLSGLSIKEISGKLDRSFKTVNNHIYNIYKKTDVSSRLELLNLIKENMLVG